MLRARHASSVDADRSVAVVARFRAPNSAELSALRAMCAASSVHVVRLLCGGLSSYGLRAELQCSLLVEEWCGTYEPLFLARAIRLPQWVCVVGVLRGLRDLHKAGYMHRDVKVIGGAAHAHALRALRVIS